MTTAIDLPTAAALAAQLDGPLLFPDSPGYRDELAGFNTAVHHRPDLVVGAANAADVQRALQFAAAHNLSVGVQATGHGASAKRVEGGMLLSTRRMDGFDIDPVARTVTVGAGTRWRPVIAAAARHGLAPLSGSSSDSGAVGYTVGGGLPVMGRTFGFVADRVRSFELVTADGVRRHVDAASDPELFWGLCGGKGNLGVVTAMTIELMEVASVYGGGIFFAASDIPAVLHAYPAWAQSLSDRTSSSVAVLRLPPAPELPEPLRGQTVAHLRVCHVGDPAEGARLVAPMRSVAPALVDRVGEMPFAEIDSIHQDPDHPLPYQERGVLLRTLTTETIDALLAVAGPDVHAPLLLCEIRHMGGALDRGPVAGNAVGGRGAAFSLFALGLMTPENEQLTPAALDAVISAVAPWSSGRTLVNLHGPVGDEADRARAWDAATYRRLADLARRMDPMGLLRHGHAIGRAAPAG